MAWLPSGIPGLHHQYTPPAGFTLAKAPPLPMPSASINPANIYRSLQGRRNEIRAFPNRLNPSEAASAFAPIGAASRAFHTGEKMVSGYHEAALCEMDFSYLANTITGFINNGELGVVRALEQLKACVYFRQERARGAMDPGHLHAYQITLNLYTALQQLGRTAIGATITYGDGGFYIYKDGDRVFVGSGGIRRGGKRSTRRQKRRKQKKTRRVHN